MHETKKLLTIRDVAARCQVTPRAIQNWVAIGFTPAPIRIGRRVIRWEESVIDEWIADGCPERPVEEMK